jgi:hypothetical protein
VKTGELTVPGSHGQEASHCSRKGLLWGLQGTVTDSWDLGRCSCRALCSEHLLSLKTMLMVTLAGQQQQVQPKEKETVDRQLKALPTTS